MMLTAESGGGPNQYRIRVKQPGNKACSCGRTISFNAKGCRNCLLLGLTDAIAKADQDITRHARAGNREEAAISGRKKRMLNDFREEVARKWSK